MNPAQPRIMREPGSAVHRLVSAGGVILAVGSIEECGRALKMWIADRQREQRRDQ